MSKRHCDRLISSAETVQTLGPIGPKSITTESQARELARVEPARREEVTMGPTGPKDVSRPERVTARSVGDGQTWTPNLVQFLSTS